MNPKSTWATLAAAVAASLSLEACVTTTWSMPTASRMVELGIVDRDADIEALDRGRVTAIMDCRGCHRQYWPQEVNSKRWPALGRDMGRRAAMKASQIDDLVAYMVEASRTAEFAGETSDGGDAAIKGRRKREGIPHN